MGATEEDSRMVGHISNRSTRRRFLAGSAMAAASGWAAFAAACGGSDDKKAETTSGTSGTSGTQSAPNVSGGTPKAGGRLREINTEPDSYDPHRDAGYPGLVAMSAVYNGLLRTRLPIGEDYKIEGDLASGAPEQPDGTTYIFKLNENIKWQNVAPVNGRALTADDIRKNFERMVTNQPDFVLRPMFEMIDKIDTPDAKTVTVK